jgi:hypothetical protein
VTEEDGDPKLPEMMSQGMSIVLGYQTGGWMVRRTVEVMNIVV